jgi:hypothetical protein
MTIDSLCSVPAALLTTLLLTAAAAQTPPEGVRPTPPPEVLLQSVAQLLGDTVFVRQPLVAEPQRQGSAHDIAFATVRDGEFDADGKLATLVVAAAPNSTNADKALRLLPAKSVKWDVASKRWLVTETTLVWAELAEVPALEPKKTPTPRPRLASELLAATLSAPPAAEPVDPAKRQPERRITWWFTPEHEQLAFATVPHGDKHLPIPWTVLRLQGSGDATRVEVPTPAIENAPTCTSATEPPAVAARHHAYVHFGAAVPKWERPAEPGKDAGGTVGHGDPGGNVSKSGGK